MQFEDTVEIEGLCPDDSQILFQSQNGIVLRVLVSTVGTVTGLRVLPAFCECQDHFYVLRDLERYC